METGRKSGDRHCVFTLQAFTVSGSIFRSKVRVYGDSLIRTELNKFWPLQIPSIPISAPTVQVNMGRGKFKGKPTGRRQFSTPEEMSESPFLINYSFSTNFPSYLPCCALNARNLWIFSKSNPLGNKLKVVEFDEESRKFCDFCNVSLQKDLEKSSLDISLPFKHLGL